jgi:hypothetical protein
MGNRIRSFAAAIVLLPVSLCAQATAIPPAVYCFDTHVLYNLHIDWDIRVTSISVSDPSDEVLIRDWHEVASSYNMRQYLCTERELRIELRDAYTWILLQAIIVPPLLPLIIPDYGDVDGDGKIDSADVTFLRRFIAYRASGGTIGSFIENNPSFDASNADVNGDGNIDANDVALLRLYISARGEGVRLGPESNP